MRKASRRKQGTLTPRTRLTPPAEIIGEIALYVGKRDLAAMTSVCRVFQREAERLLYATVVFDHRTDHQKLWRFALTVSVRDDCARHVKALTLPAEVHVLVETEGRMFAGRVAAAVAKLVELRKLYLRDYSTESPVGKGQKRVSLNPPWALVNARCKLVTLHDGYPLARDADDLQSKYLPFLQQQHNITDITLSIRLSGFFPNAVHESSLPLEAILPNVRTVQVSDVQWLTLIKSRNVERISVLIMPYDQGKVLPDHMRRSAKHLKLVTLDSAALRRVLGTFGKGNPLPALESLTIVYDTNLARDARGTYQLPNIPVVDAPALNTLVLGVFNLRKDIKLRDTRAIATFLSREYVDLQKLAVLQFEKRFLDLNENVPMDAVVRWQVARRDLVWRTVAAEEMDLDTVAWRTMV